MYKKKINQIFILIFVVLVGLFQSQSFATNTMFDFLSSTTKQSKSIDELIVGDAVTVDLYKKNLDIVKNTETLSMNDGTKKILEYYNLNYPYCNIKGFDVINILYNANSSFYNIFQSTILNGTSKKVDLPTDEEIQKSYKKFLVCNGTTNQTYNLNNQSDIEKKINTLYQQFSQNKNNLQSFNQNNFGDDLFWNGSLDDSDYDLMIDINNIGDLFFQSFKPVTEIVFYSLPNILNGSNDLHGSADGNGFVYANGTDGNNNSVSTGNSISNPSLSNPLFSFKSDQNIINQNSLLTKIGGLNNLGTSSLDKDIDVSSQTNLSLIPSDVKNFIKKTNVDNLNSFNIQSDVILFKGDSCITGIDEDLSSPNIEISKVTVKEYISGVLDYIKKSDVGKKSNDALLEKFNQTSVAKILAKAYTTTGTINQNQIFNTVANSFIESAMNQDSDQTTKCVDSCNDLRYDDKIICTIQCTCKIISGPKGKGLEGMEDMYKIRFCAVPVQQNYVTRGKTVFSIEEIFTAMYDILQGLSNGGEMIKHKQTKEFLDSPIEINLADNFAFNFSVVIKPLFKQASKDTIFKAETILNKNKIKNILNSNDSSPEEDNYNKYIIVADVALNKANLLPINTLLDRQKAIENFNEIERISVKSFNEDPIKTAQNEKIVGIRKTMTDFLNYNVSFWTDALDNLDSINSQANILLNKIKN